VSDEMRRPGVLGEARMRRALLDAVRGTVHGYENEYEGKAIMARYRPSIAATIRERLGPDPAAESVPVLNALNFYADLFVELLVDGRPAAVGRAELTLETLRLMVHVGPEIAAHVEAWVWMETMAQRPDRPDDAASVGGSGEGE